MSIAVIDPGFIVPEGMTEKDTRHPMNIYKQAIFQQSQAAADQRWDPQTRRVRATETFVDFQAYMTDIYTVALLVVLMILVWSTVSQTTTTTTHTYILILVLCLAALYGIKFKQM